MLKLLPVMQMMGKGGMMGGNVMAGKTCPMLGEMGGGASVLCLILYVLALILAVLGIIALIKYIFKK